MSDCRSKGAKVQRKIRVILAFHILIQQRQNLLWVMRSPTHTCNSNPCVIHFSASKTVNLRK
ncbi:MAG: hypothetical protein KME59_17490 [Trichormus sp. ATA11-4-KO1]|nr:hypothetical protein [Trichormus sp. ATA11-4-KO1]